MKLLRRYGKLVFLITAAVVVGAFLFVSNKLISDLAAQERERMQIWADATKEIINSEPSDFLINIIQGNTTIPVLLTDDEGNILMHRNFDLPDKTADDSPFEESEINRAFLQEKLAYLSQTQNVIHINITPEIQQHLYYEDSTLLKRLSYYPYVQIIIMLVFIAVVYFAVLSAKKAEQNKVWVGLSKETAHQLGTPISSLMAWLELLPEFGVDPDTVGEMNKDVQRLSTIASRFSKIGSKPQMERGEVNSVARHAVDYMGTRISPKIKLGADLCREPLPSKMCAPLFEWVMENLIKNAVDAMEGQGSINVTTKRDKDMAVIEISDTGKGIRRKDFKKVFYPGFTTKKRGWGLGLTLAKRIIEEYHRGRIYVKSSTPGHGTVFRVELPLQA